jgi:homoserine dehydrogenase
LIEKIVGLADTLNPIALIGAGGIGKTFVALAVLHHERIEQRFAATVASSAVTSSQLLMQISFANSRRLSVLVSKTPRTWFPSDHSYLRGK